MTVPVYDDEAPRLAEIGRAIGDFRNEFRSALSQMVRRDVYDANMQTIGVQMEALRSENARLNNEIDRESIRLTSEIEKDRTERKTSRNIVYGAALSSIVSFVVVIVQALVK